VRSLTRPFLIRLVASLIFAILIGAGLAASSPARDACVEECDGDCWIATQCDSCDEGDPNDCFISWDSGDQECYTYFACHWSCPDCYVIPPMN
jgi:hypothetical protein